MADENDDPTTDDQTTDDATTDDAATDDATTDDVTSDDTTDDAVIPDYAGQIADLNQRINDLTNLVEALRNENATLVENLPVDTVYNDNDDPYTLDSLFI